MKNEEIESKNDNMKLKIDKSSNEINTGISSVLRSGIQSPEKYNQNPFTSSYQTTVRHSSIPTPNEFLKSKGIMSSVVERNKSQIIQEFKDFQKKKKISLQVEEILLEPDEKQISNSVDLNRYSLNLPQKKIKNVNIRKNNEGTRNQSQSAYFKGIQKLQILNEQQKNIESYNEIVIKNDKNSAKALVNYFEKIGRTAIDMFAQEV